MGDSLLRGSLIKFTRLRPGLYLSHGYDGGSKMDHIYHIEHQIGLGWILSIDGKIYRASKTIKDLKEIATDIERRQSDRWKNFAKDKEQEDGK